MDSPLEVLGHYGIPTHSSVRAVDYASLLSFEQKKYERIIAEVIGADTPPKYTNLKEARFYFRCVVAQTVEEFLGQHVPDMDVVWERAQLRARRFIEQHPWSIKIYKTADGEDADGKPKQRKGAKKEQAEELYLELNNGVNDRHAIIEAFVDQIEMSHQGATTYFHNLKKEFGYKGPKTERKKRTKKARTMPAAPTIQRKEKKPKGPSKSAIAEQVYLRLKDSPKKDIIAAIVTETGTSPAGANTYFCKWRKVHGEA